MGEGERPLREVVLARGDEAERRRREDLDFSAGSGEDTEGLLRRLGGVLERVSGEDDAERLLRESLAFLVSSGDDRELRRRGGVRDLVLGSGEDLCLEGVPDPSLSPGEDPDLLLREGVLGKPSFSSGEAELLLSRDGVLGTASSTGEETL